MFSNLNLFLELYSNINRLVFNTGDIILWRNVIQSHVCIVDYSLSYRYKHGY